jgi:hypothetical protein
MLVSAFNKWRIPDVDTTIERVIRICLIIHLYVLGQLTCCRMRSVNTSSFSVYFTGPAGRLSFTFVLVLISRLTMEEPDCPSSPSSDPRASFLIGQRFLILLNFCLMANFLICSLLYQ